MLPTSLGSGTLVNTAAYFGMVANIDENMGLLMNKLDEFGLTKNTMLTLFFPIVPAFNFFSEPLDNVWSCRRKVIFFTRIVG